MSEETNERTLDRKDFLKGVGKSVAGVALFGGVSALLTACQGEQPAAVDTSEAPQWPFTYVELDADKAAERGFNSYKADGG